MGYDTIEELTQQLIALVSVELLQGWSWPMLLGDSQP